MFRKSIFCLALVIVGNDYIAAEETFEGVVRPMAIRHFKGVASIDWPVTVIHFAVGDQVKKGDTLLEFDPALKTVQLAEIGLLVVERSLVVLEKELVIHKNTRARYEKLDEELLGAVSVQELERCCQTLASHEAKIEVAKASIELAKVKLGMAKYHFDNFQKMVSPIAGEVVAINCTLGMVARAESKQLVWIEVVDASVVEVIASVPWQKAKVIRKAEDARVLIEQGEHIMPGIVTAVPMIANESGMVPLIIRVSNPALHLIPGAKAEILLK